MKRSVWGGEKYHNPIVTASRAKAILGGRYESNLFMSFLLFLGRCRTFRQCENPAPFLVVIYIVSFELIAWAS